MLTFLPAGLLEPLLPLSLRLSSLLHLALFCLKCISIKLKGSKERDKCIPRSFIHSFTMFIDHLLCAREHLGAPFYRIHSPSASFRFCPLV